MITQKVPQSFKEAVDAIEEELKTSGDTAASDMVILSTEFTFYFFMLYYF